MHAKKRFVLSALFALGVFSAQAEITVIPIDGLSRDFIRGADISMLPSLEEHGAKFYDRAGIEKDALAILKDSGVNWVRLRLWNAPVDGEEKPLGGGDCDLARTVALAARAKKLGLKVLVDFHYSDFWADPGKQAKPAAWGALTGTDLEKAVYDYTRSAILALRDSGALPDMVQIGNETNNGMLWPDGQTWCADKSATIGGFDGFAALLSSGARAVRDATPKGKRVKIVIHLANGGDNGLYRWVFDELAARKVDFDVIGLSWYPYWHGPMKGLAANLADLASRYGKELAVVETAYAWTLADGDGTGNLFKMALDADGGYLPTVQGQASFIRDCMATVAAVPGKKGLGIFYWEPCWIPVAGAGWKAGEGCSWENQALFDGTGHALESLSVFGRVYGKSKDVARPTPVRTDAVSFTTVVGDPFRLPQKVMAVYSDDTVKPAIVLWEPFFPEDRTDSGTVVVAGHLRDAETVPAQALVTFTKLRNLFPDPSFETGTLQGWTLDGPAAACFAESNSANAHSGKWTYKYWLDKPFTSTLRYRFDNLEPGAYTLSVWAMGGGGDVSLSIAAEGFGGKGPMTAEIKNTGWQQWKEYAITDIPVSGKACTVCITIKSASGTWGNFDDVKFFRQE
jgi:arabinogalactan endo-1,4-beta-galactosidase